ncbi:MAG: hypothetical protein J7L08_03645 [Candidatus Aenigmarchaeota archaeon]|nr:hypothetical protein [Candidatus Aenigmarchaeota archaeon]
MIHDYYLSKAKEYTDKEIARNKKEILNKVLKDKEPNDIHNFYPNPEDLQNFPANSVLLKISFTLKKPYISKDEGEFHIIEDKIFKNPIVRDKFTGLPMVRPSTWKGHLRFASRMVEWDKGNKEKIIRGLFGNESEEDALRGRLYFFPTFFEEEAGRDVITPLKRDTRTPARGPISLEVMKPGSKGNFYLLYVPYSQGKNFKEEEVEEDLRFLAKALQLMFYTYGFSAKKTSGFGVIEYLEEENVVVYPKRERKYSQLYYVKSNDFGSEGNRNEAG